MGIYVGEIPELHWRHWEIQDTVRFNRHQRTLAVKQVNLWEIFSAVFKVIRECIGFASNCLVTSLENSHRAHKRSNASRTNRDSVTRVFLRLDFRRSLVSGLRSSPRREVGSSGRSAGSYSRTAAGNWAYVLPSFRQTRPSYTLRLLVMFSCVLIGACYCYGLSFIALALKMFESFFILITASWVNGRKI